MGGGLLPLWQSIEDQIQLLGLIAINVLLTFIATGGKPNSILNVLRITAPVRFHQSSSKFDLPTL